MAKNETTEKDESQMKAEAYNAATNTLKAAHRDEWHGYVATEMTARGIQWEPRKTPQEKAAEKLAAILAEFPELAQKG